MYELEDKRVRRTRKIIKTSLLELMCHKNVHEISVSELSKHADINRKTFYNHYSSIENVCEDIENEFVEKILKLLDNKNIIFDIQNPYPFFNKLTQTMKEYENEWKLLIQSEAYIHINHKIKVHLRNYFKTTTAEDIYIDENTFMFFIEFISGGISAIYSRWIENDQSISFEELSSMICITVCGASTALRQNRPT